MAIGTKPDVNATAPAGARPQPVRFRPNERHATEFGKVMAIMMASPRHRRQSLRDLFTQVMPCLLTGQYVIAGAKVDGRDVTDPIAFVLWANVSDAIDQRLASELAAPTPLAPNEWRSGAHAWVIDAVGPSKIIEAILTQIANGPIQGRPLKLRRKSATGQLVVESWPATNAARSGEAAAAG